MKDEPNLMLERSLERRDLKNDLLLLLLLLLLSIFTKKNQPINVNYKILYL